jgi:hypothetical protein
MAVGCRQGKTIALFANKSLIEETAQLDSAHADHYEAEDKTNDLLYLQLQIYYLGVNNVN